jgi:hypothetical protein
MGDNLEFTGTLTRDFCRTINRKIIFHPESAHEAQFIADQLLAMGFVYYRDEYAGQMDIAATGQIYLDTDKTIMVGSSRDEGTKTYSADSFSDFYIPNIKVDAALTGEDVLTQNMLFYPRSVNEARAVLGALMHHGAKLLDETQTGPLVTARAVTQGIFLRKGKIGFAPAPQDIARSKIRSSADLGVNPAAHLSAEQITMMAAFNEMTARMTQMAAKIERLEAEILPAEIDKRPSAPASLRLAPKRKG